MQDCAWMTGLILLTAADSLFFCALTSILRSPCVQLQHDIEKQNCPLFRFIYVRTSLQDKIQRVFKRNAFTSSFLVMGVFYTIFNIFVYVYDQKEPGINRLRLVLYHACMDPLSKFRVPLITVMPISQFLLYGMNLVNISCNFYLYMFLEVQRKTNSGCHYVFP